MTAGLKWGHAICLANPTSNKPPYVHYLPFRHRFSCAVIEWADRVRFVDIVKKEHLVGTQTGFAGMFPRTYKVLERFLPKICTTKSLDARRRDGEKLDEDQIKLANMTVCARIFRMLTQGKKMGGKKRKNQRKGASCIDSDDDDYDLDQVGVEMKDRRNEHGDEEYEEESDDEVDSDKDDNEDEGQQELDSEDELDADLEAEDIETADIQAAHARGGWNGSGGGGGPRGHQRGGSSKVLTRVRTTGIRIPVKHPGSGQNKKVG